jgi:hypothetical protein
MMEPKNQMQEQEAWNPKNQMQELEALQLESAILSTLTVGVLDFILNTDGWSLI